MTDDKTLALVFILVALIAISVGSSRSKQDDRRLRTLELRVQMLEED